MKIIKIKKKVMFNNPKQFCLKYLMKMRALAQVIRILKY